MIKYTDFDIVFQEIPDEITLAINLSRCPNRCKGCHTPSLMEDIGEELTENRLSMLLLNYATSVTCICFMGGDESREEIEHLARFIHKEESIKTAWYSGREFFPIDKTAFDFVKLGNYVEELGGLRSRTTNQRLFQRNITGEWEDITVRFWK